jgi:uncharacterized protein (DUF2252 family)
VTAEVLEPVARGTRIALGKSARARVKRTEHAYLPERPATFDLIDHMERTSIDRVPSLLPIRHFRMASSTFAFYRGTAALMALDLDRTPTSGILVQISGDAHCANFGAFATPERNVIFDVRDFDETLPGPWEWDLKRLCASLVLAARDIDAAKATAEIAAANAARAYRDRMLELARLSTLDTWYARVDVREILESAGSNAIRKRRRTYVDGIERRTIQKAYDDMTELVGGRRRFVDEPEPIEERCNIGR